MEPALSFSAVFNFFEQVGPLEPLASPTNWSSKGDQRWSNIGHRGNKKGIERDRNGMKGQGIQEINGND